MKTVLYTQSKKFLDTWNEILISAFYKQANLSFPKSTQPCLFSVKQCTKLNQSLWIISVSYPSILVIVLNILLNL